VLSILHGQKEGLLINSRTLAQRIALVAKSKKAQDVVILDMRKVVNFCDYFVIASGTSLRQVNAIVEAIQEDLYKEKRKPLSMPKSYDESGWMVLDFGDVVAHTFYEPMREFYALEHLWSDAKKVQSRKNSASKKHSSKR
jgi:ribosome-associated protein